MPADGRRPGVEERPLPATAQAEAPDAGGGARPSRHRRGPRHLLLRHVAGCPTCRTEVARRRRMLRLLHQLGDPSAVARPLPVPRARPFPARRPTPVGPAGPVGPVGEQRPRRAGARVAAVAATGALLGLGTLAVAASRHGSGGDAAVGPVIVRGAGAGRIGALLT